VWCNGVAGVREAVICGGDCQQASCEEKESESESKASGG